MICTLKLVPRELGDGSILYHRLPLFYPHRGGRQADGRAGPLHSDDATGGRGRGIIRHRGDHQSWGSRYAICMRPVACGEIDGRRQ